jgi:hypothetical protein
VYITFAAASRLDDAPGHHFMDDRRLPGIVQGSARSVEGLAHGFCCGIIEDATG